MNALAPPAERRALRLAFGLASARGRRASNQDYAAFRLDPSHGREAAETSVRAFIDGYYGASRHIPPLQAASRALEAVNGWIAAQGRRDPALENMATTFTALLLTGGCAHVLHVGDSRAYRLSGGRLEQLTEDHVVDIGEPALRLRRAIGFEPQILIDHAAIDLAPHDRLLLCTDGLHNALPLARLTKILGEADAPPETARRLIEAALDAGSADNVTALVVDVLDVPQGALENFTPRAAAPPRDRDALLFWRMLSGVLALCLMLDLLLRR